MFGAKADSICPNTVSNVPQNTAVRQENLWHKALATGPVMRSIDKQ